MDEMKLPIITGQTLDNRKLLRLPAAPKLASNKKKGDSEAKLSELKKGAKAFESYFVQSLLKEMRKSIKHEGNGSLRFGEGMYQSMFDEAIAEKISENGGMGLANILIKSLSKNLKVLGKSTDKINE